MLRLPAFVLLRPKTVQAAVAALQHPGARLVAGGTDLLPNLKHRLEAPEQLISLADIADFGRVERDQAAAVLRLGAGITLARLAADPLVTDLLPMLAEAAAAVASPQIRNRGTLGGNVNLDTRCRYVNQTAFWRGAIGGCLKSEGSVCHVVPGGRNCVASMSSDTVPALISLDARAVLVGPAGTREISLDAYFGNDGTGHTDRRPGEIMSQILVPIPQGPRASRYVKWRVRGSIDFPLISIALRFDLDGDGPERKIAGAKIVVGALNAKPKVLQRLDAILGHPLADETVATAVADAAFRQCKPLENIPYEADYRRKMIRVLTRRAVVELGHENPARVGAAGRP